MLCEIKHELDLDTLGLFDKLFGLRPVIRFTLNKCDVAQRLCSIKEKANGRITVMKKIKQSVNH